MYSIILKTHFIVVTLFFIIYLIKTILLLASKNEALASFSKKVKVPEMIISFLFLATGIYLMTQVEIKPLLIVKITIVFLSIPLAVVGFKKGNKGLATLAFLLIVGAFGIGEMMKKKTAVVTQNAVNTDGSVNAQEIYAANCTSCHGADGKAKLAGALDLSVTTLTEDSMAKIMLEGRGMMTPINGLTPEQAKAIAVYVNTNIKGK